MNEPCGAWYGAMFVAGVIGTGLAVVIVKTVEATASLLRR